MLDDIKILDFTHVYFGPYSTMIMADMGAEIIKIEPPWGEMTRMSAEPIRRHQQHLPLASTGTRKAWPST